MESFRTGTMSLTLVRTHLCKALIVNTILPDQLQEMVDNATAQREMKFIKMRNLTMKVLPEFIQMFSESKELSSIKLMNN